MVLRALRISERYHGTIDLIVSDVVMPELSGPALIDRLAMRHPEARVLFMSGYTDDALAPNHFADRGSAFLAKPFTPAALIGRVREVLDSPHDQRSPSSRSFTSPPGTANPV